MKKKQMYAAPATEVLELHSEGVVCSSPVNVEISTDSWGDEVEG